MSAPRLFSRVAVDSLGLQSLKKLWIASGLRSFRKVLISDAFIRLCNNNSIHAIALRLA
jgi:hypothetical protein